MTKLDRVAPTRRPDADAAGTQRWRDLLFLHWSFPVEVVRALVPEPLAIDAWDGRAWVGLVPFVMRDIRSAWMPRGAGLDFLETNVRTYVHHDGVPGVYFFSLEASSWLAVRVARLVWNLPYFHAEMAVAREDTRVDYRTTRKGSAAAARLSWEIGDELGPSEPGSFEHFLLERYVLFSFTRAGTLRRGHVHHVPYPARRAKVSHVEQTLVSAAGLPLDPKAPPEAIHCSEGVDVEVFGPWDVPSSGAKAAP